MRGKGAPPRRHFLGNNKSTANRDRIKYERTVSKAKRHKAEAAAAAAFMQRGFGRRRRRVLSRGGQKTSHVKTTSSLMLTKCPHRRLSPPKKRGRSDKGRRRRRPHIPAHAQHARKDNGNYSGSGEREEGNCYTSMLLLLRRKRRRCRRMTKTHTWTHTTAAVTDRQEWGLRTVLLQTRARAFNNSGQSVNVLDVTSNKGAFVHPFLSFECRRGGFFSVMKLESLSLSF